MAIVIIPLSEVVTHHEGSLEQLKKRARIHWNVIAPKLVNEIVGYLMPLVTRPDLISVGYADEECLKIATKIHGQMVNRYLSPEVLKLDVEDEERVRHVLSRSLQEFLENLVSTINKYIWAIQSLSFNPGEEMIGLEFDRMVGDDVVMRMKTVSLEQQRVGTVNTTPSETVFSTYYNTFQRFLLSYSAAVTARPAYLTDELEQAATTLAEFFYRELTGAERDYIGPKGEKLLWGYAKLIIRRGEIYLQRLFRHCDSLNQPLAELVYRVRPQLERVELEEEDEVVDNFVSIIHLLGADGTSTGHEEPEYRTPKGSVVEVEMDFEEAVRFDFGTAVNDGKMLEVLCLQSERGPHVDLEVSAPF